MTASRRTLILLLSALALAVPTLSQAAPLRHRQHSHASETQALIRAVINDDEAKVVRLLIRGADSNANITKLNTKSMDHTFGDFSPGPLLASSLRNCSPGISLALIAYGANVNARDGQQCTPLALAVANGTPQVVAALLRHGAEVNARLIENGTALFSSIDSSGQDPETVRLLIAYGADVNVQESVSHQTALMQIAGNFDFALNRVAGATLVKILLTAHPNLELRDIHGDTALRLAEKQGNSSVASLLRAAGAKEHSLFPPIVVAEAAYTITDLGPGCANAINSHGDVAGIVSEGSRNFNGQILGQAFLWSKGVKQTWKGFGGPSSVANDINDQGQVVGSADFAKDGISSYTQHAFFWQNGIIQDLHPTTERVTKEPDIPSRAISITDDGQVAEEVNTDTFLWRSGHWQDLKVSVLEERIAWEIAVPVALDSKGQVVLRLGLGDGGSASVGIWENGRIQELTPPKIIEFVLEGEKRHRVPGSYAESINDRGEIVGYTDQDEPLLWTNNKVTPLPRLYQYSGISFGMHAEHINNRGQIVGTVSDSLYVPFPEQHAVLWSGGKALGLNTLVPAGSGWLLGDARSINDAGQIVGRGKYRGKEEAFLLTPKPVPTPG